jgi:HlyD family secretion protein
MVKMKKRTVIIVISVFLILVTTVTAYVIWKGKKDTKIVWSTVQPEVGDIQILVTATGTVNAVKTVLVGTQVSGVISKIYVDFNDNVKAGQVIAVLDTRSLQVILNQAVANLSKAQTQLEQLKGEYDRNQILMGKQLISASDFELQASTYKVAQTTVQTAEGDLSKAKINLGLATITAPISGVIISRNVDVGQTVAASFSTPTLFTIANDLKKMQLQANVDEADIGQIQIGQEVFFNVDAYPEESFTGIVQQLRMQPITLNNVVSYAVMIDAPNDELKLLPGMNANISIIVQKSTGIIKIPMSALNFSPPQSSQDGIDSISVMKKRDSLSNVGKSLVFVLNNGLLTPVEIQLGLSDGIKVEVKNADLTVQSELVLGVKGTGTAAPKSKGLIQTPSKTPRIR